jgi:hypothetical protein
MTTYATDIYSGDGTQVEFGVTFKFIQRSHVKVYRINDSDQSETELTFTNSSPPTGDEYVWQSDILIKVGTAPTNVQKLRIERDTPEDLQLVQWADGSYIVAEDLNTSDKQWLYNIQELEDQFSLLSSTAIKYRGTVDLTVDAAPANPNNGDFFINSGSGTVVATWTGIDGDNVTGSEQVIYNSTLGEWELLETPASQKGVLEVRGTAPIQVDTTDAQRPVVSVDAATTTDAGVITEAASDGVTYGRENGAWVAVANTAVGTDPPASPSNGDGWYDLNSGRLFLWVDDGNSSQWAEANPGLAGGGGASVEVDDTPPTTPKEGDLWWDSSDGSGRLYVWYEDADTNQWVEASPGGGSGLTEVYWTDSGTALSPKTAGRDVTLGAGDVSATDGTFSGNVSGVDGTFTGNVDIGSSNIQLNADGSSTFANSQISLRASDGRLSVGNYNSETSTAIYKGNVSIARDDGATCFSAFNSFGSGTPTVSLNADGSATFASAITSTFLAGTGYRNLNASSSGTITTGTSDERLKENISSLGSTVDKIKSLNPVTFQWKNRQEAGDDFYVGFIAQEMEKVFPELAYENSDGMKGVNYAELVAPLTKALQESIARIETLEAANASLEARLTALEGGTN